jgi:hypothetical protein
VFTVIRKRKFHNLAKPQQSKTTNLSKRLAKCLTIKTTMFKVCNNFFNLLLKFVVFLESLEFKAAKDDNEKKPEADELKVTIATKLHPDDPASLEDWTTQLGNLTNAFAKASQEIKIARLQVIFVSA